VTEIIRVGDPPIEVRIRRNPRARRLVLRVTQDAGVPTLTVPPLVALSRARAFAVEQEGWLRSRLAVAPARMTVGVGSMIPYRGEPHRVVSTGSGRVALAGGSIMVPGPVERAPARAEAFLREAARQRCLAAAETHAERLGRRIGRLTIRDTRGRWGSCSAAGDLMFSWRLILAPDAVLDYVAAHEAAHLVELNHSRRFWMLVESLVPDMEAQRGWLRRHGGGLMAYDFAPQPALPLAG
jgi:predicted metal-dependent hydrolase